MEECGGSQVKFEKSPDWAGLILEILTNSPTKIDISLDEENNVISLSSERVGKAELIPTPSGKIDILVEDELQGSIPRMEVIGEIIRGVEKKNLVNSEKVRKVINYNESLFGVLVKLTALLKGSGYVHGLEDRSLDVKQLSY